MSTGSARPLFVAASEFVSTSISTRRFTNACKFWYTEVSVGTGRIETSGNARVKTLYFCSDAHKGLPENTANSERAYSEGFITDCLMNKMPIFILFACIFFNWKICNGFIYYRIFVQNCSMTGEIKSKIRDILNFISLNPKGLGT